MVTEASTSVKQKTIVGASWMVVWRFCTRALGLVSTFVLARILVPGDFGLLTMATAVAGMVDALSQVQLQDALVRTHETDRALYNTAFTMQVARALLTGAIVAALAPAAVAWFEEPRLAQVLLVIALSSAIGGFENIGIIEFRRDLRFNVQFGLLAVPRLCQVFVAIAMALLLRSYWALLIGTLVFKTTGVVMSYMLHPYRPGFTLGRWRSLIGFSFWTWASSIALVIWARGDPFILGGLLGATSVGYYLIAGEIAALPISELVAPATNALFAGMAAAQNRGTDPIAKAIPVGCMLLLCVMPLSIGLSATSGYLTNVVLGPSWMPAQKLIAIFAWVCVFSPLTFVATTVLTVRGKVRQNFVAVALAAGIKSVAVYVAAALTHRLEDVAIVAVVCQAIETLAFLIQLRRVGGVIPAESRSGLFRMLAATGITVGVLGQTGFAWSTVSYNSLWTLIYGLPLGAFCVALYCAIHTLLWVLAGRPGGPEADLVFVLKALGASRLGSIVSALRLPAGWLVR